uniref:Uncharacterized protein n=1 Tax=Macaca fascicularis TaxID=9541 RepID=A0A7N9CW81_MACFA
MGQGRQQGPLVSRSTAAPFPAPTPPADTRDGDSEPLPWLGLRGPAPSGGDADTLHCLSPGTYLSHLHLHPTGDLRVHLHQHRLLHSHVPPGAALLQCGGCGEWALARSLAPAQAPAPASHSASLLCPPRPLGEAAGLLFLGHARLCGSVNLRRHQWLPVHLLQAMLLWSPRGAPAQPAGHDPRQTLHPHPCPPRLCKLGDLGQAGCGAGLPAMQDLRVMAGVSHSGLGVWGGARAHPVGVTGGRLGRHQPRSSPSVRPQPSSCSWACMPRSSTTCPSSTTSATVHHPGPAAAGRPALHKPIKVNLLIPVAYLVFWAFLLVFSFISEPMVCGVGIIIILTGVPIFFLGVYWRSKPKCVHRLTESMTRWGQELCLWSTPGCP